MLRSTPGMHKAFYKYQEAYEYRLLSWKNEVYLTWEWWLGVALTALPWILWLIFRKKESTDRLLYAGFFVSLISLALDGIGIQLGAWNYLKPVTPVIPSYLPYDLALMPVMVMFLIQLFPKRNPWLIGLNFGLLTSFVGEPIFEYLKIYEPKYWKHWFSLPIYTVIYFVAYKLASRNQNKELS
jgi:hypothetical protein